jgi:polypyrimidine tract-binding protein 1
MGMGMGMGGMNMMGMQSSVVLVDKLNQEAVTPDALFNLFGVYGDVVRVKILFNKRDTALVQYRLPDSAAFAVKSLSNCPFLGTNIAVTTSKHKEIKMPRSDGKDAEINALLTKDFTSSKHHRYKNHTFMNPKNMHDPSQVLYLANVHESATAQQMRELFGQYRNEASTEPILVEFFKTNRKLCYIGMPSIEESVRALSALHGYEINGWAIRISFSKKTASTIQNEE